MRSETRDDLSVKCRIMNWQELECVWKH